MSNIDMGFKTSESSELFLAAAFSLELSLQLVFSSGLFAGAFLAAGF